MGIVLNLIFFKNSVNVKEFKIIEFYLIVYTYLIRSMQWGFYGEWGFSMENRKFSMGSG